MPHLSPMNWIMAIMMTWFTLMLLTTNTWWNKITSMPFKLQSTPKSKTFSAQWYWH